MRGTIGSPGVWPQTLRFLARTGLDLSPLVTTSVCPLADADDGRRRWHGPSRPREGAHHDASRGSRRVHEGRGLPRPERRPDRGASTSRRRPGPASSCSGAARSASAAPTPGEYDHGPGMFPVHAAPASGHLDRSCSATSSSGGCSRAGAGVERSAPGDRVVSGAGVSCGHCRLVPRRPHQPLRARTARSACRSTAASRRYVASPAATCRAVPDAVDDDAAAIDAALRGRPARGRARRRGPGTTPSRSSAAAASARSSSPAPLARAVRGRVVALDIDAGRLETARALGADEAVDASGRDLAELMLRAHRRRRLRRRDRGQRRARARPHAAVASARRGGRVLLVGLARRAARARPGPHDPARGRPVHHRRARLRRRHPGRARAC